jgi:preprotein translocase subunit SecF
MMSRIGNIGGRLYRGEVSFNFVSRQRVWYTISGFILLISIVALLVLRLNFSVDFKGGAVFTVSAPTATQSQVQRAVTDGGGGTAIVQSVGVGSKVSWRAQTKTLTTPQLQSVQNSLSRELGVPSGKISTQSVGASWGGQISHKALEALIIFLIVIVIYLTIAFE